MALLTLRWHDDDGIQAIGLSAGFIELMKASAPSHS
jgi:hypothetical protein